MRNRRIFKILAPFCVGLVLLPLSVWAAGALRGETDGSTAGDGMGPLTATAGLASMSGSLDEDRLEARARHDTANAVAAQEGRRATTRRSLRQRVSRAGARLHPSQPPAPLIVPGPPDDVWAKLRRCEAGGDYRRNSGNGYYGAYQFSAATWRSLGYPGLAHQASPAVQDEAARRLQRRSGWGQWPACSRRIRAR